MGGFIDLFTQSDSDNIEGTNGWLTVYRTGDGSPALGIRDNAATVLGYALGAQVLCINTTSGVLTNTVASAIVGPTGGTSNSMSILFRCTDAGSNNFDGYYAEFGRQSGNVDVWRVASTGTRLNFLGTKVKGSAIAEGSEIKILMEGTTITVLVNDVQIGTTITNAVHASGYSGIGPYSDSGGFFQKANSFSVNPDDIVPDEGGAVNSNGASFPRRSPFRGGVFGK